MDYKDKFRKIANAYYNLGLEKISSSELSYGAEFLKKALHYNKYHTDARNLLGLVFYEMGETSDALVQWVISMNLDPSAENRADYYLDEVERKPDQLSRASVAARKFNQALYEAQRGAEDFAMLELTHIIRDNPDYVKARLLLAVLYMQSGENLKAGAQLMEVLKKDRSNRRALMLMDEVKHLTGRAEIEQKKMNSAFSHREMEDDDVIIPKAKRQATADQVVLFIVIGILIGLLSFYVLLLPGIRKKYITQANEKIVENSREISELNSAYQELQERYDRLESGYSDVSEKLRNFEEENTGFISMYQKLSRIINDYQSGALTDAAMEYATIDRDIVSEEPLASMMTDIDRYMLNDGFDILVKMGTDNWNAGKKDKAEQYYDTALGLKPDDPECMYLKARLLQSQDRISEANAIFDRIVGEHPESGYADRAVAARGY